MAAALSLFYVSLALVAASLSLSAEAGVILEDGYTVTTVIYGHKLNVNPYHVLPLPYSSDLVILDYPTGVFYSAAFPTSEEVALKPIAGDGKVGWSDGELGSAQFYKPKNFAVDLQGNVYVADKANHVIRKISSSGVTTIAGGYSNKVGNEDGPAQNATFSSDFELVLVAQQCALLVADHGNQLVRQIALKSEDCTTGSPASPGVGAAPWWILGLALSCIFGITVGFAIRPYVIPLLSERPSNNPFWLSKTWKLWIINLVKEAWTLCFDIRSGVASLKLYTLLRRLVLLSLYHVSLMFRINNPVGSPPTPSKDFVSLIDSDFSNSYSPAKTDVFSNELMDLMSSENGKDFASLIDSDLSNSNSPAKSDVFPSELMDLMSSENGLLLSNPDRDTFKIEEADQAKAVSAVEGMDCMIEANIRGLAFSMKEPTLLEGFGAENLGLVKRR